MKRSWDSALTAALVLCALITTGLVVRREFFAPPSVSAQSADQKPRFVESWKSDLERGVRLGSSNAPVQLIEFADFECPFCATFHKTLKTLRERYPTQVSLIYIDLPLEGHRFALSAARAAECAGDQGRFEAMHDRLFEMQDSFGLRPWSDYASEAGVPDLVAFAKCVKQSDPVPRVEEGKQLSAKVDVKETPTLIVNGWRLGHPPSLEELDAIVKAVLAGKSPVAPAKS